MSDEVKLSELKIISNIDGCVMHALKSSQEKSFTFGEAYFSTVNFMKIKGWKKHLKMTMNIIVPLGKIKFVIYDNRGSENKFYNYTLSKNNYKRLTIPPNVWLAFQGLEKSENILLNISNIEHDPDEVENKKLNMIRYNWDKQK